MATGFPEPLPARRIFGATAYSLFGLWVWALHLALVYAVHHVACRTAGSEPWIAVFIVAVTAGGAAVLVAAALWPAWLVWLVRAPAPDDSLRPFLDAVMRWLAALGLAGIIWAGAALVFIDTCAP